MQDYNNQYYKVYVPRNFRDRMKKIVLFFLFWASSFVAYAILPDRDYRFYPEKLGLIYKDLTVSTSDGLKIKTWFFPAQKKLSQRELDKAWNYSNRKSYKVVDNKKRPTIIICNGDAGNMSYQQLHFAQFFTDKGYNVVTFDWRGFGQSSEWKMNTANLAYTEFLMDYDAVIKVVMKQVEVDTSRMAVFGWSTGAYLSMSAASKYNNIKCFVAIGLITSFKEVLPIINALPKNKNNKQIAPKDYPQHLQPIFIAPSFNKASFLIVGEFDDRAPKWMSEKIYKSLSGKKELWIVNGAGHTIINESQDNWDLLNKRIADFFDKNL